jgi:hypothetical protein
VISLKPLVIGVIAFLANWIDKVVGLRFVYLNVNSIGHLITETEIFLDQIINSEEANFGVLIFIQGNNLLHPANIRICNQELFQIIKKRLLPHPLLAGSIVLSHLVFRYLSLTYPINSIFQCKTSILYC